MGIVAIAVTRGDAVLSAITTGTTLVTTAVAMLVHNRRRHKELLRLKKKLSAHG